MISRINHKNINWVDIFNPSNEEIAEISSEFILDNAVKDDIATPTLRSTLMEYEDYIYMVMHFPQLVSGKSFNTEIDFIIGKHYIITIHYDELNIIDRREKIIDNAINNKTASERHTGHIFLEILGTLYRESNEALDPLDDKLMTIEKSIYSGHERRMVGYISDTIHHLIDFDHAFRLHDKILLHLIDWGGGYYDKKFKDSVYNLRYIYSELVDRVNMLREDADELRSTNDSLLQHKTSDAMKTLTMMSFVIFPLSLIAGIFGMNAENIPIVGSDYDFEIIISIMFSVTIGLFAFFKWKKWI